MIGVFLGVFSQVFAIVVFTAIVVNRVHVLIKRCSPMARSFPRGSLGRCGAVLVDRGHDGRNRVMLHPPAPSSCSRLCGVLVDKGQHGRNKVMLVL